MHHTSLCALSSPPELYRKEKAFLIILIKLFAVAQGLWFNT